MTYDEALRRPDLACLLTCADRLAPHGHASFLYDAFGVACAESPGGRRLRAMAIVIAGWSADAREDSAYESRGRARENRVAMARFYGLVSRTLKREARRAEAGR